jgi:hypothetical protein
MESSHDASAPLLTLNAHHQHWPLVTGCPHRPTHLQASLCRRSRGAWGWATCSTASPWRSSAAPQAQVGGWLHGGSAVYAGEKR